MAYGTECELCHAKMDGRRAPRDMDATVCSDCEIVLREHRDAIPHPDQV